MLYSLKADKLIAQNHKGEAKSAIYIAPESLGSDSNLGRLFIVAEISSKEKKVPEILDQTIKELSEYYYHSPTKNSEAALETTCQYFNENILDISNKNAKWVREKFNILLATIQKDSLILSNLGDIKTWLVRQGKMHEVTSGQNRPVKTTSKKLLNQIISGQLEQDDVLLFTNNIIFDYFSHEKIKKTVSTLMPAQACAFFKNTILDYKVPIDFNTIILKFNKSKKESNISIPKSVLESNQNNSHRLEFEPKNSKLNLVFGLAKNTGQKALQTTGTILNNIKNKKNRSTRKDDKVKTEKVQAEYSETGTKSPKSLSSPLSAPASGLSKHRLKIAIALIAIIFISSLFLVNRKQEDQQKIKDYEQLVTDINDKINASEAALIYKDEDKAENLLAEAKQLAGSLPQNTEEQAYNRQQLLDSINDSINRIYHIEAIKNPVQITSLNQLANISSNLTLIKNNLYLAEGGAIYKINPSDANITRIADLNSSIDKITLFDNNLLLLKSTDQKFFLLNVDNNSSRQLSFSPPEPNSQIIDYDIYAQKLYLLSSHDQKIYKYSYNTSGFSTPANWLAEDIALIGNQSIAVDGNIWAGMNQGKLSKFFKGKKEIFKLTGTTATLSDNTTVYTAEELDNLYLLDKQNKKIIISNKQGKINKTLLIPETLEAVSIIPNSDENQLYLMTNQSIYQIQI